MKRFCILFKYGITKPLFILLFITAFFLTASQVLCQEPLEAPIRSGQGDQRHSLRGNTRQETDFPVQYSVSAKQFYSVAAQKISWPIPNTFYKQEALVYYPLSVPENSCPVVVFSHGLGVSPEQYAYLGKMWASRGIVSFFLSHPGSDSDIWHGTIRPFNELKSAFQRNWSGRERALAIHFAINRIYEMHNNKSSTLGAIMDPTRLGVSGNNLGALGALLLSGQLPPDNGRPLKDQRITAVLALSPTVYCTRDRAPLIYSNIDIPFISFSGTDDNGIIGKTKSYQRRYPYEGVSSIFRHHVTLLGADHQIYSGHQLKLLGKNDTSYQQVVMNVSMVFWGTYLLKDPLAGDLLNRGCPNIVKNFGFIENNIQFEAMRSNIIKY